MVPYIIKRILIMIMMLTALSMVVYVLFFAIPSDPAALTCGKNCTPDIIAANRSRLGLDKPLPVQYIEFIKGIFMGRTYGSGTAAFFCHVPCFGYSFNQQEQVTDLFVQVFPVTAYLALGAFVLWMIMGVTTGILAARVKGSIVDRGIMGMTLVGYSLPSFFIGLLIMIFFVIRWHWVPFPDYLPPQENFFQFFQTMIFPWVTLATLYAAYYTRLTRSQMLDTMSEDYIRTARAKGLPEKKVIRKHAFRAGLTPIVTSAGMDFAGLLGGAVVTEKIFHLGGLGNIAITAVNNLDLPILVATTLLAGVFVVVANLIVDILYAAIDPRVRIA